MRKQWFEFGFVGLKVGSEVAGAGFFEWCKQRSLKPFKTLGVADAVFIRRGVKTDSVSEVSRSPDPSSNVRYSRFITAILIDGEIDPIEPSEGEAVGIIFLRLSRTLCQRTGAQVQIDAAVAEIRKIIKGSSTELKAVLEGVGGSELILLVQDSTLTKILSTVCELRKSSYENCPRFETTVTVPCIDPRLLYGETELNSHSPLLEDKPETVVLVDCLPSFEKRVEDEVRTVSAVASVGMVFGKNDLRVTFKKDTSFADVLRVLRVVQNRCADYVVGTETRVSECVCKGASNTKFEQIKLALKDVTEEQDQRLVRWLQESNDRHQLDAYDSFYSVRSAFLNAGASPVEASRFNDLRLWVNEFSSSNLQEPEDKDDQFILRQEVLRAANLFFMAYGQRASSLGNDAWASIEQSPGQWGGVSRLLTAASAIPQYVYKNIFTNTKRKDWYGFLLTDAAVVPRSWSFGIANIPRGILTRPAWWWNLAHEVGHTWQWDRRYLKVKFEELYTDPKLRPYGKVVEHCLADLAAKRTFFGTDWDSYHSRHVESVVKGRWINWTSHLEVIRHSFRNALVGFIEGHYKYINEDARDGTFDRFRNVVKNEADASKARWLREDGETQKTLKHHWDKWATEIEPILGKLRDDGRDSVVNRTISPEKLSEAHQALIKGHQYWDEDPTIIVRAALDLEQDDPDVPPEVWESAGPQVISYLWDWTMRNSPSE